MFTDIAAALPDVAPVMFDYNTIDPHDGSMTVLPLGEQAEKLSRIVADAKAAHPGLPIDLICHSQGCVVAALAKPTGIRTCILLAPPATLSIERMKKQFGGRPGTRFDLDGLSLLQRSDGTFTKVPLQYWESIQGVDVPGLFNELASVTGLTIVQAVNDEVVGATDFSALSKAIKVVVLQATHNFDGDTRQALVRTVAELLA